MPNSAGKKSILLLGGSRHQVPAIECAKRLGYRTVLCDYLPDNPGQYAADVFYQESTTDWDLMLSIARKEDVSGVLAFGTDVAAGTAAYVCENLNLPTNPLKSVEVLSEKHLFRDHLEKSGLPCPRHATLPADSTVDDVLDALHDKRMQLPVVLKPTDSSGSKGVTVLADEGRFAISDALDDARGFSRNQVLELEEFIHAGFPRVIGGDVFVVGGHVRFWGIMSCLRDKAIGGLVPVGERWPSGLNAKQLNAVKDQIQALVTSLGMRFGEMNVEIIVDDDDVPHFLELAARAGGNMIPNQLSDISGIDLIEANVRFAMGDSMDVDFDGVSARGCYCTYMLHARSAGTYRGVEFDSKLKKHVYRVEPYINEGSLVSSFNNSSKAIGVAFLRFDDVTQMEEILEHIDDLVHIAID